MKRTALYIRVSTVDQHPENQLNELRQYAGQRGLQIVNEYTDHGVSGTKARRPALDKMLDDARRHKFDVVLVWSCDRLARTTKHLLQVLDELNFMGMEFISQSAGSYRHGGPIGAGDHRYRIGHCGIGAILYCRTSQSRACVAQNWKVGRSGDHGWISTEGK